MARYIERQGMSPEVLGQCLCIVPLLFGLWLALLGEQFQGGCRIEHVDLHRDAEPRVFLGARGDERMPIATGGTPAWKALRLVQSRRQIVHDPQIGLACGEFLAEVSSDFAEILVPDRNIME